MTQRYIDQLPRKPRDEEDLANLIRSLHFRIGYAYVYGHPVPTGTRYSDDVDAGKLSALDDLDTYHVSYLVAQLQ